MSVAETWTHLYYQIPACEWRSMLDAAAEGYAEQDETTPMSADFHL